MTFNLGIDLGGTNARAAVVDSDGTIVAVARMVLTDRSPAGVVEAIAAAVSQAMASWQGPVFGYLIAGHGIYAWGKDAREARRHLEAYAHLLQLVLEEERRA